MVRITRNCGIMGGEPCIEDTRLPVWGFIDEQGQIVEARFSEYQPLTDEQCQAVRDWVQSHPETVAAYLRAQRIERTLTDDADYVDELIERVEAQAQELARLRAALERITQRESAPYDFSEEAFHRCQRIAKQALAELR